MVGVPPELWDEYADDCAEQAHYPPPHDYTVDDIRESDSDESDEQPDPTHECMACGKAVCIESEPRTRTTHWCDSCDSVTRHHKL